ncbi:trypsin-like peptidase domain-containing protein [Ruminococcus sp.]|uniref:S1 family peptidase n=1 Tax=Ruminococcus sp. TaxID=41978 RepID=UPI0025CB92E2|nr:trypsin-like peptidase domain-containing protein [Ruminococcus sp.]MBQ8965981.1 trypsin-like peptidase domain-containing protein [Ruminococcus sp.]
MNELIDKLEQASRDCFLRAVGVNNSYVSDVLALDDHFRERNYLRIDELVPPRDPADLDSLRVLTEDFRDSFEGERVLKLYAKSVPAVNPTIENNLIINLLHWQKLLTGLGGVLVYGGKTGYKEYLFCYLAYLMGRKVLMLMPSGEGKLAPQLLERSALLTLGEPRQVALPPYADPLRPQQRTGNPTVHIPPPLGRRPPQPPYQQVNRQPAFQGRPPMQGTTRPVPPTFPPPRPVQPRSQPPIRTSRPRPVQTRPQPPIQTCPRPPIQPGPLPPRTAPINQPPPVTLSLREVSRLSASVVMIDSLEFPGNSTIRGSGIVLDRNGFILTSFGLIRNSMQITVLVENDSMPYHARVIKYHDQHDLAVIKIDRPLEPMPIYRGTRELYIHQNIFFIGSSGGAFNTTSEGTITDIRRYYDISAIQFSAKAFAGSSGGAVLNTSGELIGMCYGSAHGLHAVNMAISIRGLLPFINGFL